MRFFVALALALAPLVACGGGGNGRPDADVAHADAARPDAALADADPRPRLEVSFAVSSAGPGAITCQVAHPRRGTDTLVVYSHKVGDPGGDTADLFDCDAATGTTSPLAGGAGSYDVRVALVSDRNALDPSGWVELATTAPETVEVAGLTHVDAAFTVDVGFLEAGWTIHSSGGTPLTCAQVTGQDAVSILSTAGSGGAFEDLFDCADGTGAGARVITSPVPLDAYTVALSILDIDGLALGAAAPVTTTLVDGGDYNELGVLDLVLD